MAASAPLAEGAAMAAISATSASTCCRTSSAAAVGDVKRAAAGAPASRKSASSRGSSKASSSSSSPSSSSCPSPAPANSSLAFFFFCRALDRLLPLPATMNLASSSTLLSASLFGPILLNGPLSSDKQMTHSNGGAPAVSKALQSKELESQTSRSTCTQIHHRFLTNFWPFCLGSSTTSVVICRTQRPRSMRRLSRCPLSGFTRTGPAVILSCWTLASLTRSNSSNSMWSLSPSAFPVPSATVASFTTRMDNRELWYLCRPFS
mmetsp:Transcript_140830/g.450241  ORF Transcript_140830/g.450241 Transcript_140830/m.450241 type:complete len:263 (-) Transcript_140830:1986-2774(-)